MRPTTTWIGSGGFVPDEEIEDNKPWNKEDEVFANAELTGVVDVRELVEAGKHWGKVFDLMSWPLVDITDETNAIELP